MTRQWATDIGALQDALRDAILAEQALQAADLPVPLHGDNFDVVGAINSTGSLMPVGVRVLPPANTSISLEVSHGFEAVLRFPCMVHVSALTEEDVMELLRDAVGLVIDALQTDPTLGGLCAGPSDPGITMGVIDVDGGDAAQEVIVALVVRNG